MILIGQYDSPFVRRVGLALTLYDLPFKHEPWSAFGDTDTIGAYNPLRRVPTLVMDDGVVLLDSAAILDVLDDLVGPERAMMARTGPDRREALRVCAFASGAADKAVSLVYERALRETALPFWVDRCRAQISDTLAMLNQGRAARPAPWWFGQAIGHADIMLGCLLRFIGDALPEQFDLAAYPALAAHSAACEALPAFQAVQQPFKIARG